MRDFRCGWFSNPRILGGQRPQTAAVRVALVLFAAATTPGVAAAHPSGLGAGDPWWQAWHFDSLVVFNLVLLAAVYARGLTRIWGRSGVGQGVSRGQVAAFAAGLLAVLVALMSPLDTLSDDLSWVHMTQHMVLMTIAAPLMVLGAPGLVSLWALPRRWRSTAAWWPRRTAAGRSLSKASWNPFLAWGLHAAVLWGWHLPVFYELALHDPLVHDIEHLSFFLAACLFWRVVVDSRSHLRLNAGLGVLYLFTTSLHATMLGVFMALSPTPWYAVYVGRTELWRLSPLEDQQLAGLIMWMPACMVYAIAAAILFAVWLQQLENPTGGNQLAARPGGSLATDRQKTTARADVSLMQ